MTALPMHSLSRALMERSRGRPLLSKSSQLRSSAENEAICLSVGSLLLEKSVRVVWSLSHKWSKFQSCTICRRLRLWTLLIAVAICCKEWRIACVKSGFFLQRPHKTAFYEMKKLWLQKHFVSTYYTKNYSNHYCQIWPHSYEDNTNRFV